MLMAQHPVIQLHNLSKTFGRFRKFQAVRDLSLDVSSGQVYGFLGPNGAGKTTTIRLILGLLRPTSGHASLYGAPVRSDMDKLRKVGALVEGAAFYPYLTGYKNLQVLARTYGEFDPGRIDELLDRVNLRESAKRRVKHYSTGMKQRLGLAAALLHDPELIILDEPTNGLDPAGIQEMRVFIRDLVDEHGKTVFLSSHMLNEVEQVCDRVAIIRKGEIVHEGAVADVIEAAQSGANAVLVRVSPVERALPLLQAQWPVEPHRTGNGALHVQITQSEVPQMVRHLAEAQIDVYEVTPQRRTLEDFFLEVTEAPKAAPANTITEAAD
jgi:ABC-2 type transport system ATP-binding protein